MLMNGAKGPLFANGRTSKDGGSPSQNHALADRKKVMMGLNTCNGKPCVHGIKLARNWLIGTEMFFIEFEED